jgi:hypothetical protein
MIIGESARFCVEEYKLSPKMMILPDSLGISVHYTQFPQEPREPWVEIPHFYKQAWAKVGYFSDLYQIRTLKPGYSIFLSARLVIIPINRQFSRDLVL